MKPSLRSFSILKIKGNFLANYEYWEKKALFFLFLLRKNLKHSNFLGPRFLPEIVFGWFTGSIIYFITHSFYHLSMNSFFNSYELKNESLNQMSLWFNYDRKDQGWLSQIFSNALKFFLIDIFEKSSCQSKGTSFTFEMTFDMFFLPTFDWLYIIY